MKFNDLDKYYITDFVSNKLEELKIINKKMLVATSGGLDSTALLLILNSISKTSNLRIQAVHINYKLRKQESDDDEVFIRNLCNKIKIPITTIDNFTKETKSINLENSLRIFRYKEFSKLITDTQSYGVITAHHLNDHVETFLMKIARGSGLQGMEGIKEFTQLDDYNELKIYRPLIEIPKQKLYKYCLEQEVFPRYDYSNNSNLYSRNRVRNIIIPEFEKLNSNFLDSVNRITKLARQLNIQEKTRLLNKIETLSPEYKECEIYFSRIKFNKLTEFDKKLILKIITEKLSSDTFIENKHLDYIIEKSESSNNKFSLDLPNSLKLTASKISLSLSKK